jgi:hypothetical protein
MVSLCLVYLLALQYELDLGLLMFPSVIGRSGVGVDGVCVWWYTDGCVVGCRWSSISATPTSQPTITS